MHHFTAFWNTYVFYVFWNTGLLGDTDIHMVTHFIIQFEEVPFVIITTDLIRKIFMYWNVVKLTVKTFSKILIFN